MRSRPSSTSETDVDLPLAPGPAVLVSSAAWAIIGITTGYIGSRLPMSFLDHDTWLTRIRRIEDGGRIYQRRLRIGRWKSKLPEAGGLFGGPSKRHLGGTDVDSLAAFAAETRRAELVHWSNLLAGPLFFIWCPPGIGAVMAVFGVVFHAPFICIQRSNRGRITRVIDARRRRSPGTQTTAENRATRTLRSPRPDR